MGVIKRNPNRANSFVIYGLIAAAMGVVAYLWLDYRHAKQELRDMRDDLRAAESLTASQSEAIKEFQKAQEDYRKLLAQFEQDRAQTRREISELRNGFSAETIREEAARDEDTATGLLTGRANDLFGMFDDTTGAD